MPDNVRVVRGGRTRSVEVETLSSPLISKLKRAYARAAVSNPNIAPLATGVTVTDNAATDAALTNAVAFAQLQNVVRISGGCPTPWLFASRLYAPSASYFPADGDVGSAIKAESPALQDAVQWCVDWSTETQSQKVQFQVHAIQAGLGCQFLINGQYTSRLPTVLAAAGERYLVVDTGSPGAKNVTMVTGKGVALRGIRTLSKAYPVFKPEAPVDSYVVLNFADSFGEGFGTDTPGISSFLVKYGRSAGWTDNRNCAAGSTGVITDGGNPLRYRLMSQIERSIIINSDLDPRGVDRINIFHGYNDDTMVAAAGNATFFTATYLACLRRLRELYPNALIVVFGVQSGKRGDSTVSAMIEAGIQAAFQQFADVNSRFIAVYSAVARPITGTGYVGSENGTGNSDVAIGGVSGDIIHPNTYGSQEVLAPWFINAERRLMATL